MFIGYATLEGWERAAERAANGDVIQMQQLQTRWTDSRPVPYSVTHLYGTLSFIDTRGYVHYWRMELARYEWPDSNKTKRAAGELADRGWEKVRAWLRQEHWPDEVFDEAICLAPDNVHQLVGEQSIMRLIDGEWVYWPYVERPDELPDQSPFDFEGKEAAALAEAVESGDFPFESEAEFIERNEKAEADDASPE